MAGHSKVSHSRISHPKVSVVVAVYNPGPNIDGLVSSLDGQSLRPDELEVVFVDDGSSDGTYERLLELARSRPNFVVTTIPNSGWPGRPRNVGTDLARGEYVFYADHDDEFFPEALERMYVMAQANGSDVVYGKVVRMGRPTPYWSLARRNVANADVMDALASRTVHKLYQRDFLREHNIRFPEGRVRLEDHNFMAQVIPRARVISVLADYPCYRWIHRPDGTNSSDAKIDRLAYWNYYAGVLRTMEATAGPGPLLDAARTSAIVQAFSRIPPQRYLKWSPADRDTTFEALHALVLEHCPPGLDDGIPVLKRLRVQALRTGDKARFEHLQRSRTQISFAFGPGRVHLEAGRLKVSLDVSLVSAQSAPFALVRVGDSIALPGGLDAPSAVDPAPCVLSVTERGTGEITIRNRHSGVEWPAESLEHPKTTPVENDQVTLSVLIDGTLDLAHGVFGRDLERGIWDVQARAQFLGEHQLQRIRMDAETEIPTIPQQVGGREVLAYRTGYGTLALRISAPEPPPSVSVVTAHWQEDQLVLSLDLPASVTGTQLVLRQRVVDNQQGVRHNEQRVEPRDQQAEPVDQQAEPVDQQAEPGDQQAEHNEQLAWVHNGGARIRLGPSVQGEIFDLSVRFPVGPLGYRDRRLMFGAASVTQRPPYRIYATAHGSFSVKNTAPPDSRSKPARRWLALRGRPRRPGGSS